jgi:CRP/FNR family transcriptional regulator, anaerobic regulatory protein
MLTMSLYSGDSHAGSEITLAKPATSATGWPGEGIANTTIRRLEPREHVCREGEHRHYIYQVEQGAVCLYRSMPDGHRQIMDFAYPGDYVGLGTSERHVLSGQAIGVTKLRCIPANAVRQLAVRNPEFCFKLYEALSAELMAARDLLATVGTRSATERVAAFLVALARRNERSGYAGNRIALPMLRADIADFLSLTVETVSRTFTRLKQRGIIDLPQSAIVLVNDRDQLERVAGLISAPVG